MKILRAKKGMSPKAMVWNAKKKKVAFTFENGEFATDDKELIKFWTEQKGEVLDEQKADSGDK